MQPQKKNKTFALNKVLVSLAGTTLIIQTGCTEDPYDCRLLWGPCEMCTSISVRAAIPGATDPSSRVALPPFALLVQSGKCFLLRSLNRNPQEPEHMEATLLNQYRNDGRDISPSRGAAPSESGGAVQLKLNGIAEVRVAGAGGGEVT